MSTSRPFAYNVSKDAISGTTQIGNLAIGTPFSGFSSTGLQWWMGPDEDLGYVIAYQQSGGTQPTQTGRNAYVQFWRTKDKTSEDLVNLTNSVLKLPNNVVTASEAQIFLTQRGYWCSYIDSSLLVWYEPYYGGAGDKFLGDLSGNKIDANLINGPLLNSGDTYYYNFVSTNRQYGTFQNLGTLTGFTVEVWFKLSSSLSGVVSSIVTNEFVGGKINFSIGTNNSPTNYNLCVGFFDGAWRNTNGFEPAINTWYQVVGTYDGTTLTQYVNGELSGGTLTRTSPTIGSNGGNRLMRRWDSNEATTNFIDGALATVKIYNVALTPQQVSTNFEDNRSRFGI